MFILIWDGYLTLLLLYYNYRPNVTEPFYMEEESNTEATDDDEEYEDGEELDIDDDDDNQF